MEQNLELPGRAFRVSHCKACSQFGAAQGNGIGELKFMWPSVLSGAGDRAVGESKVKLHRAITAGAG